MIKKGEALAQKVGIEGVPGFVIALSDSKNPFKFKALSSIRGAQPFSVFQNIMDQSPNSNTTQTPIVKAAIFVNRFKEFPGFLSMYSGAMYDSSLLAAGFASAATGGPVNTRFVFDAVGFPQCGHAIALSDTSPLHSLHCISAMTSF